MKWFVCVLCLLVTFVTVDSTFARGGGGRGIFRGGLLHKNNGGGGSTSASQNAPIDNAPTYKVEHQLLKALNAIRQQYGLRALVLDRNLHKTTRQHCGWMANAHSMIHGVGRTENIAMGQPNVDAVMTAWMNSSGHRANILNPGWTRVGLSGYMSPSGTPFWCQQFASGNPEPIQDEMKKEKPAKKAEKST
jgi:hypothetical protein